MNQNYNNPFFIFDGTGADAEEGPEAAFIEQFKKQYPTAKEAVIFANAGGNVAFREVTAEGDKYTFNLFNLLSISIYPDDAVDIAFTYPDDEGGAGKQIVVSYLTAGGAGGGGDDGGEHAK